MSYLRRSKITNYLEKILRNVFSVSTEAGYKLGYHVTRSLACEEYAEEIYFNPIPRWNELSALFLWDRTPEGAEYWSAIATTLYLHTGK